MAGTVTAAPRVLIGWAKIAEHLDVSVITAQRWSERDSDPLPVGNHTTSRLHVAAVTADVDAWLARNAATLGARKRRAPVGGG